MHFSTDQQTLNDLTIFGKPGSDSVYALFNRTQTQGGARWMEEMFRYPLADAETINSRCRLIEYIGQTFPKFPFRQDGFDIIELYVAQVDERSRLPVRASSLGDSLKGLVSMDPHFKQVTAGVRALGDLLHTWPGFVAKLNADFTNPFFQELLVLDHLLGQSELHQFATAPLKKHLQYDEIRRFDDVLRYQERDLLRRVLHEIYRLDVYLAIAKVAKDRNFCFPHALNGTDQEVRLEGVYHPHVKGAIANDLHIHPNGNIVFLTGANMAGKSTLMKSLGIAMYLAHVGFPVPAKGMAFSPREGIYTSINLPDNLSMGISHFYAEVLRVKKVARELGAGKRLFMMMDELFRGTNVKDAYDATVALTKAFAVKENCMFVVSTHIMEAGETLQKEISNIQFVYLPTEMREGRPHYTYKLRNGITADRHGMIIIRNEGILEILNSDLPENLKNATT